MFTRLLQKPVESTLLLGPRGTGKTTWIKKSFPQARRYDLLSTREALRLSRDPGMLYNEVHRLMEDRGLHFLLSGSSARKLKKGDVNLLAGRALTAHMFPLVSRELGGEADISRLMTEGSLPLAVTGSDPVSFLTTYAETYLQEEIKAEALTRNVGHFSRFLEIAARQNAQLTNVKAMARDAGVARQTVQNYFEILNDTLIGYWLSPWKLKHSTKQVSHPKFYFFDAGVARALSGRLPYPPTQEETGTLLETVILNEIRAYISYSKLHYDVHFWRTYGGVEVDVVCETTEGLVAIEMKASSSWGKRYQKGLARISEDLGNGRVTCYGIYQGERPAEFGRVKVYPVIDFLTRLWEGEIIS
jgi:predicted AAA+ superfamily ATPase